MISPQFVKIAREVIAHIRKGNKLCRGGLISNDFTTCPLGVVCLNNGLSITPNHPPHTLYDFAKDKTGFNFTFTIGFDDSGALYGYGTHNSKNYIGNSEYEIGYALGKQCDRRKWIV